MLGSLVLLAPVRARIARLGSFRKSLAKDTAAHALPAASLRPVPSCAGSVLRANTNSSRQVKSVSTVKSASLPCGHSRLLACTAHRASTSPTPATTTARTALPDSLLWKAELFARIVQRANTARPVPTGAQSARQALTRQPLAQACATHALLGNLALLVSLRARRAPPGISVYLGRPRVLVVCPDDSALSTVRRAQPVHLASSPMHSPPVAKTAPVATTALPAWSAASCAKQADTPVPEAPCAPCAS